VNRSIDLGVPLSASIWRPALNRLQRAVHRGRFDGDFVFGGGEESANPGSDHPCFSDFTGRYLSKSILGVRALIPQLLDEITRFDYSLRIVKDRSSDRVGKYAAEGIHSQLGLVGRKPR